MSRVTETLFKCPACARWFRGSECYRCTGKAQTGDDDHQAEQCGRCGGKMEGTFHKCRRVIDAPDVTGRL